MISSVRKSNSLGDSIKTLGDGVKTRAGAKRDTGSIGHRGSIRIGTIVGIGISRPLANVVSIVSSIGKSSLGHRVKSLGDWVKTRAGTKGDTSIGIGVTIAIGKIGSISISISFGSSHKASKEAH